MVPFNQKLGLKSNNFRKPTWVETSLPNSFHVTAVYINSHLLRLNSECQMAPGIMCLTDFEIPFCIFETKHPKWHKRIAMLRIIKHIYTAKIQEEPVVWHDGIAPRPPEAESHPVSTARIIKHTGTCVVLQVDPPRNITQFMIRSADCLVCGTRNHEPRLLRSHFDSIMQWV